MEWERWEEREVWTARHAGNGLCTNTRLGTDTLQIVCRMPLCTSPVLLDFAFSLSPFTAHMYMHLLCAFSIHSVIVYFMDSSYTKLYTHVQAELMHKLTNEHLQSRTRSGQKTTTVHIHMQMLTFILGMCVFAFYVCVFRLFLLLMSSWPSCFSYGQCYRPAMVKAWFVMHKTHIWALTHIHTLNTYKIGFALWDVSVAEFTAEISE